eukprot:COSAG06_NODE_26020_length_623_cov_1.732824_2_plen_88_part_01
MAGLGMSVSCWPRKRKLRKGTRETEPVCGVQSMCVLACFVLYYLLRDAMHFCSPSPSAGSIPAAACSLSAALRLQKGRAPIAYSQRSD